MVQEKIIEMIAEQFEMDRSDITPETTFDELYADDLDMIDIAMSLEDEFRMEVPDEALEKFNTVADVIAFISGKE